LNAVRPHKPVGDRPRWTPALAGVPFGLTEFGVSGGLEDVDRCHGIGPDNIVLAALDLVE
jgi:hypothetical protein